MEAMEFFQLSAGSWRSLRTTHHLPFRRAEAGGSDIEVETLAASDPKIVEICNFHQIDPALSVGGAQISWDGAMAWDKEGDSHAGSSVFALVPDADSGRRGRLLRERGYAEEIPVVGRYELDGEDALVLATEYESMSTIERFWFPTANLRIRTSTVKRFGGLNTATFCAEIRTDGSRDRTAPETAAPGFLSLLGW
jgi:hypothetical protein